MKPIIYYEPEVLSSIIIFADARMIFTYIVVASIIYSLFFDSNQTIIDKVILLNPVKKRLYYFSRIIIAFIIELFLILIMYITTIDVFMEYEVSSIQNKMIIYLIILVSLMLIINTFLNFLIIIPGSMLAKGIFLVGISIILTFPTISITEYMPQFPLIVQYLLPTLAIYINDPMRQIYSTQFHWKINVQPSILPIVFIIIFYIISWIVLLWKVEYIELIE